MQPPRSLTSTQRWPRIWHKAIFLKNEFLKTVILPELAGRILSLYHKVARREVFPHNHVTHPALIGVRSTWIAGGLEFNFPDADTAVAVSLASRLSRLAIAN